MTDTASAEIAAAGPTTVRGSPFKLNETFMKHFVLYGTLGNSDTLPLDEHPKIISVTATKWSSSKQAQECKYAKVTRAERRESSAMAALGCTSPQGWKRSCLLSHHHLG